MCDAAARLPPSTPSPSIPPAAFGEPDLTVNDSSHTVLEHLLLLRIHLKRAIEGEALRIRTLHGLLALHLDSRSLGINGHDRLSASLLQLQRVWRSKSAQ